MPRRTAEVTISAEGRDKGKVYLLTEMPSAKAERWAFRALSLLIKSGVTLPDGAASQGMIGLAAIGPEALFNINFDEVEPLLDQMMECVQVVGDPSSGVKLYRPMVEDDIEEVKTRLTLRLEVFALHTGFSVAELRSKLTSAQETKSSSSIPTSPQS